MPKVVDTRWNSRNLTEGGVRYYRHGAKVGVVVKTGLGRKDGVSVIRIPKKAFQMQDKLGDVSRLHRSKQRFGFLYSFFIQPFISDDDSGVVDC